VKLLFVLSDVDGYFLEQFIWIYCLQDLCHFESVRYGEM
jgi:hypothetical protein